MERELGEPVEREIINKRCSMRQVYTPYLGQKRSANESREHGIELQKRSHGHVWSRAKQYINTIAIMGRLCSESLNWSSTAP